MSKTPEHAQIEEQARQILYANPYFISSGRRFEFRYEEDVLTVEGTVPTFHMKQLLQTALRKLHGIKRVDNRVSVEQFKLST